MIRNNMDRLFMRLEQMSFYDLWKIYDSCWCDPSFMELLRLRWLPPKGKNVYVDAAGFVRRIDLSQKPIEIAISEPSLDLNKFRKELPNFAYRFGSLEKVAYYEVTHTPYLDFDPKINIQILLALQVAGVNKFPSRVFVHTLSQPMYIKYALPMSMPIYVESDKIPVFIVAEQDRNITNLGAQVDAIVRQLKLESAVPDSKPHFVCNCKFDRKKPDAFGDLLTAINSCDSDNAENILSTQELSAEQLDYAHAYASWIEACDTQAGILDSIEMKLSDLSLGAEGSNDQLGTIAKRRTKRRTKVAKR